MAPEVSLPDCQGGYLAPLLLLSEAQRADLWLQANIQRSMLIEFSRRVDLSHATNACDEIREICLAFTTGTSQEIRSRRASVTARLAGCDGMALACSELVCRYAHTPASVVSKDAEKTFTRIAQAAVLGLLPPTPHVDRSLVSDAGSDREAAEFALVSIRFAAEVLQRRPLPEQERVLKERYQGPRPSAGLQSGIATEFGSKTPQIRG